MPQHGQPFTEARAPFAELPSTCRRQEARSTVVRCSGAETVPAGDCRGERATRADACWLGCTCWHASWMELDTGRSRALATFGKSARLGEALVSHASHRQVRPRVDVAPRRLGPDPERGSRSWLRRRRVGALFSDTNCSRFINSRPCQFARGVGAPATDAVNCLRSGCCVRPCARPTRDCRLWPGTVRPSNRPSVTHGRGRPAVP